MTQGPTLSNDLLRDLINQCRACTLQIAGGREQDAGLRSDMRHLLEAHAGVADQVATLWEERSQALGARGILRHLWALAAGGAGGFIAYIMPEIIKRLTG